LAKAWLPARVTPIEGDKKGPKAPLECGTILTISFV
jgi:hypothetical protein